jgi:hypothetical protein
MSVFKAPAPLTDNLQPSIFLAGSIDMGAAHDWQAEVCNYFSGTDKNIYNPRREDWDNNWEQKIDNPPFNQQVNWQLAAMEKADLIIMNFLPNSASPITLLELGLHASSKKLLVCCPDEYYRSGNVQIICNNYKIPLFKQLDQLLQSIEN